MVGPFGEQPHLGKASVLGARGMTRFAGRIRGAAKRDFLQPVTSRSWSLDFAARINRGAVE
ncbi:hypothetical protein ACFFI2_13670 [Rhodococcus jostii]